jgi:hypothetical protein
LNINLRGVVLTGKMILTLGEFEHESVEITLSDSHSLVGAEEKKINLHRILSEAVIYARVHMRAVCLRAKNDPVRALEIAFHEILNKTRNGCCTGPYTPTELDEVTNACKLAGAASAGIQNGACPGKVEHILRDALDANRHNLQIMGPTPPISLYAPDIGTLATSIPPTPSQAGSGWLAHPQEFLTLQDLSRTSAA